ncbi:MAG: hypothetical protein NTX50_14970 [Candidatus Sumerlaeota bacterium]|nr:hypothetical protein [Candidatus Sumerlaeota bacterium]
MSERPCNAPNRVYMIGDSVGLARGAWHGSQAVPYDETYAHLLMHGIRKLEAEKNTLIEYIPNHKRSRQIMEIKGMMWELPLFQPTIFIVQTGIGDCSPRVFRRWQRAVIDRIKPQFVKKAILGFVHKHRRRIISTLPQHVYTPLPVFESACDFIAETVAKLGIHPAFISIAAPGSDMAHRSPGPRENVIKYNAAYQRVVKRWNGAYIDCHSKFAHAPDDYVLADGHHLNARGHRILADLLEEFLRRVIK